MDVNWYGESNREVRNKQFLRLYKKNIYASRKVENMEHPLLTSFIGGVGVAGVVAVCDKAFNLDLSPFVSATGFFVGEFIALLPLAKRMSDIYVSEKKMLEIIEKNGGFDKTGYYTLIDNVYYLNKQAYFNAYYDEIKPEGHSLVKSRRRSK